MTVFPRLRATLGFAKRIQAYGSVETARTIQRNLPHITHPLRPEGGEIACDALGLRIAPRRHEYLLRSMLSLDALAAVGGHVERDEAGDPVYVLGSVHVRMESADDIGHLKEIFVDRVYDFAFGGDALVLDIGLNVGVAALFFAATKGWEVVGYEPFPDTADTARRNVQASGLEARIEVRNAALSDRDGTEKLPYDPQRRGRNSLFFDRVYGESLSTTRDIVVQDAAKVFREMRARAGGRPLIVKMDCEGAEYPILDRLESEGLMESFEAIVLEHHPFIPNRSGADLQSMLIQAGFIVHPIPGDPGGIGLLWAVRAKRLAPATS